MTTQTFDIGTAREVRAPRGTQLTCKGWLQEAAMRMIMNNLDPEVAEKPDELVVYGGSGKAARTWGDFDAIVEALKKLENDETLLVQSGRAVGVAKTLFSLTRAAAVYCSIIRPLLMPGSLVSIGGRSSRPSSSRYVRRSAMLASSASAMAR